jgi:hypothetical protein
MFYDQNNITVESVHYIAQIIKSKGEAITLEKLWEEHEIEPYERFEDLKVIVPERLFTLGERIVIISEVMDSHLTLGEAAKLLDFTWQNVRSYVHAFYEQGILGIVPLTDKDLDNKLLDDYEWFLHCKIAENPKLNASELYEVLKREDNFRVPIITLRHRMAESIPDWNRKTRKYYCKQTADKWNDNLKNVYKGDKNLVQIHTYTRILQLIDYANIEISSMFYSFEDAEKSINITIPEYDCLVHNDRYKIAEIISDGRDWLYALYCG